MVEENESLLFGERTETLKKAVKLYAKTTSDLDQDVNILIEWMKTQPHLPEIPGKDFLSNVVLLNKFSIEKCKKHLDIYYSLRGALPEIFADRNFRRPHMQVAGKLLCYVAFPKLTDEGYRVSLTKLTHNNADEFNLFHCVGSLQNLLEIRMIKDVMMGEIFVVDLGNLTFAHVTKCTPVHVKKVFMAAEKVYKNVVKQLHFVNVSPVVEGLVSLVKQLVSKKLSERIYAHQSMEGVYKFISKDIFPKEYGGPTYSLEDLREKWYSLLEKYEPRLNELEKIKTDESKRPTPLKNDELLGFHGNFKKLNVD